MHQSNLNPATAVTNFKMSAIKPPPNSKMDKEVPSDHVPHPFSFPFPPYELQKKLMTDMYDIFADRKVGILESPTGTGKTLSSLCAVLTFIEDEYQSRQRQIEEDRKKANKLRESTDEDTFEESLAKFKQSEVFLKAADSASEKIERVQSRIEAAKERMKEYKTVKGAKMQCEDIEEAGVSTEKEEPPELLKVVYATRTHSQIDQLTKELGRTRFKPRVVSVGSRAKLCPNSEVKSLPNALAAEKCKDLRETNKCPYYKRAKARLIADHILSGASRDLNDVFKESLCFQACGYYGSREAVPFCELIFVPYATLFDAEMRKSVGLNIDSDTVVIVDEAHNLYATLTEMSSAMINLEELQTGISILKTFLEAQAGRLKSTDFKNLRLFLTCLETAAKKLDGPMFGKMDKLNFKTYKFMDLVFCGEGLRYIQAIEAARKGVLFSRIRSFMRSKQAAQLKEQKENLNSEPLSGVQRLLKSRRQQPAVTTEPVNTPPETEEEFAKFPLFKLAEFFSALGAAGDNFEVIVTLLNSDTPKQSKTECSYHLLCLNGGEKFGSIVAKARSTVLIGGTMRPADLVINLLTRDCGISMERIVERSYGHIIDAANLRIVTIKSDQRGPLTLNHAAIQNKQMHHRILAAMAPFINDTPHGLAVFFPSRAFLANFLAEVKVSKPPGFAELTRRGYILEGMFDDAFDRYTKQANTGPATFFAVIGGKFSEGVNFNDNVARCVIIVGMPYPNVFSDEFRAKSEFLKHHFKDESIAAKLPLNICMTAVNQTIGRVVRHKNDYGVVVLIDSRYGEPRHTAALSEWMHPCLRNTDKQVEARSVVKGFRGMF